MAFLILPSFASSTRLTAHLGTSIMRQCYPRVHKRVGPKALCMSPAEARGYIRALAGDVVRAAVDDALGRYELSPQLREPVIQYAVDSLLDRVLAELGAAMPLPVCVSPRRAA